MHGHSPIRLHFRQPVESPMFGKCLRASVIGATLIVTVAPAIAQTPPAAQQNQQRRDDDRGLWGLAGLLGLAGLAGLMRRRDKYDTRGNTTTTTTRLP